ncbi:MAG TPA: carboxypeptidase-like regulatory domain-containing protein [Candidatus Acidoferrum sp.]|nr:carboxypeptidase-like regulatory domain-containing protein [Candidatus Acidoferrum sp.]
METPLRGIEGHEVQIETGNGGADCGTPLEPGEKFLIFAYKEKDGRLWTGMCDGNRKLSGSQEDEEIVRQYKTLISKGTTTIFGHVFHTRPSWKGDDIRNDFQPRPNGGLILRVEGKGFTTSTKTASDGSYEFSDLPIGRFRVIPELPKSLDFSHEYEENYQADLSSGQCSNISFLLQPITRIQGHLTLPRGMESKSIEVVALPTETAKVNQFSGKWAFTDEKDRFDLWPLPPGDYYVGVNINNSPSAGQPFPPTYYPGVTDQKKASVVSIGLGEVKELELPVIEIAKPRQVHFIAIGLDGKPLKSIYVQLEDLRHPGDASSYVNVDLDRNGAGMLTIYAGYSYHLHGSHWVSYMNDWCARPVSIAAGTEPAEVKFVMDHKEANCSIDEIDGLRK